MKYTQAEIKKFLEPETRFHMSAHVIQTEAVEMCRQLEKDRKILVAALKFYHEESQNIEITPTCLGDRNMVKIMQECFRRGNPATAALKEVSEI